MFSKITIVLAMALSLSLSGPAFAQAKAKKTTTKAKTKAQAEVKKTDTAAQEKAQDKAREEATALEAKALEAKAKAEAEKAAAEKAKSATQADSGVLGQVRKYISASYHGEFYFVRRDITSANKADHDIQDFKVMHNPTIIVKPAKDWKFLSTAEFKYTDVDPAVAPYPNRFYRALFLLTRENILTQAEHGVKLDVSLGRRLFDRKAVPATYGNTRINTNISRKFSESLNASLLAQYLANDPAKVTGSTWKHSIELIPTINFQITEKLSYFFNDDFIFNTAWKDNSPASSSISHEMNVGVLTYQFTDAISSYFQFKYLHTEDLTKATPKADSFEYYIGVTYAVTPKFSVTPEVGSQIFAARDGKFFAEALKYPEFALYVDASF